MNYKRLEIYTGWKCNHKCIFCIEYPVMVRKWDKEITKNEIMKRIIKYRKQGFNHITFLGGEPFIHKVFSFATLFAKKIGFTVMVTTNASMIQFEKQAEKYLINIDQLIISIPIINEKKQLLINRTKGIINFDKVFENINKYWRGDFLKVNTVINKLNLSEITNVIEYIGKKGIKELSITYPDIIMPYYSKEFILSNIAPSYGEVANYIDKWFYVAKKYDINLILTDIPFCTLPKLEYYKKTDDYIYESRTKINVKNQELDRNEISPRRRKLIEECSKCIYKKNCWGPSIHYNDLYGLDEIKSINN